MWPVDWEEEVHCDESSKIALIKQDIDRKKWSQVNSALIGCVSSPSLVKTEKMAEGFTLIVKKKRPIYSLKMAITAILLLHEKFLQFNWLRAVVFQLNLKYVHVKITNPLGVVVLTNNSRICTWYFAKIPLLIMQRLVKLRVTIYHSSYIYAKYHCYHLYKYDSTDYNCCYSKSIC